MTAAVFAHKPTSIRVNFVNNQEILAWAFDSRGICGLILQVTTSLGSNATSCCS